MFKVSDSAGSIRSGEETQKALACFGDLGGLIEA